VGVSVEGVGDPCTLRFVAEVCDCIRRLDSPCPEEGSRSRKGDNDLISYGWTVKSGSGVTLSAPSPSPRIVDKCLLLHLLLLFQKRMMAIKKARAATPDTQPATMTFTFELDLDTFGKGVGLLGLLGLLEVLGVLGENSRQLVSFPGATVIPPVKGMEALVFNEAIISKSKSSKVTIE